jgi:hypothetical protein
VPIGEKSADPGSNEAWAAAKDEIEAGFFNQRYNASPETFSSASEG